MPQHPDTTALFRSLLEADDGDAFDPDSPAARASLERILAAPPLPASGHRPSPVLRFALMGTAAGAVLAAIIIVPSLGGSRSGLAQAAVISRAAAALEQPNTILYLQVHDYSAHGRQVCVRFGECSFGDSAGREGGISANPSRRHAHLQLAGVGESRREPGTRDLQQRCRDRDQRGHSRRLDLRSGRQHPDDRYRNRRRAPFPIRRTRRHYPRLLTSRTPPTTRTCTAKRRKAPRRSTSWARPRSRANPSISCSSTAHRRRRRTRPPATCAARPYAPLPRLRSSCTSTARHSRPYAASP